MPSDTVVINTSAAPVCRAQGTQSVAAKRAAYETLRRGYDQYIILGADAQNNVGVVGYTPLTANTQSRGTFNAYGNTGTHSGSSNTYFSGGQSIIGGSHDQQLAVKMSVNPIRAQREPLMLGKRLGLTGKR